jgi:flagellar biosynthesis protein FlhF
VNEDIAYKLTEELKKIFFSRGMVDENMMTKLLTSTIEGMGVKIRPMKLNPGTRKVIALIGSSGVGKTTTAAKIAAAWKFQNKKEVALIKLDDQRIGSLDQIKIYAKIIGIPLIFVSDKKELKEAIHKLKHKDLVIIDTPGLNCNSDREIEKVYGYFANMKMVQTQLLLNATTKEKDFIHIAEKLNTLGIKRLIFTKIDESRTYGNILNHLVRTKIPVSYFSFGHEIPEGIEDASMERLLRLLLKGERADTRERDVIGDREIMTSRENRQKFTKNYFVANQNSDVFHKPGCKWTRMIKEDNVVVFKDVSEAEAKRFKPCRYCTPKTEIKYDRPNYKIRQRRIAV